MSEYKRLKENIEILYMHNELHTPVMKLTDYKKPETDLIREIVSDCREILNKIEQEMLIELPCKVGDTVYAVYDNKVHPVTPWRIWYDGNFFYLNSHECIYDLLWGSSVFASRAEAEIEAEERLKELQNG